MPDVALTLGCADYPDRTRPLIDGRVEIPGIDLQVVPLPPLELAARWTEFDVAETIMSVYMARRSRGSQDFIAIPVFPYRAFFLGNVVINSESGILGPTDLAGKRVGTPGLHLTGTLWLRGYLQDVHGVEGTTIHWFSGSKSPWDLPAGLTVDFVSPGQSLSDLLERGEVDAWLGGSLPPCFGSARVRRLFPNYRQIEEEYARRTRVFPIIHTITIRREVYDRHPWIARELYRAFERARQAGRESLANDVLMKCGLPWIRDDLEQLQVIFDGDWYHYGFEANRAVLEIMVRYAYTQGYTLQEMDLTQLFAPEVIG